MTFSADKFLLWFRDDMTDEQFDAYLVYMQTQGNRPDLFP